MSAIVAEAERIEEDAEHSSQSQFEATRAWNGWNMGIGIPTALLAASGSASALADLPEIAAFLGLLAAAGAALATFIKPTDRASQSLQVGNALLALRNDARIFRTIDCVSEVEPVVLRERLEELNQRRNRLNAEAPNPPRRAFLRARKRIEAGETTHRVDSA